MEELLKMAKTYLALAKARKQTTCRCEAFPFPHRHKSHPKCPAMAREK